MKLLEPGAVRAELRDGRSPSLARRRVVGLLAAVGLVDFAVITLYQIGLIRRLPDLPGRVFDSNRVNASAKAYERGLPDGATGALGYAVVLALASAGGSRRSGRSPLLDLALGGVVAASAATAAGYLWNMAREQEKACAYCIVGAALNFAMLPLVAPDVRDAVEELRPARRRGLRRLSA